MSFSREEAVARLREIVETVRAEPMAVPVREVWVYGDVVLGMDPIERLDVYVTKDLLFKDEPDREADFEKRLGVSGVGKTVAAAWAEEFPEYVRANANGHVAPEKCLAAHLLEDDEPIHLEVCNTGFENNVTQRLKGARARDDYTQLLDPRAACLWVDDEDGGQVSEEAFRKLEEGEFVFPTLSASLEMLGMDEDEADEAADELRAYQDQQDGVTVRGDVV
ncbi:hypothetical protein HWV23_10225 [Natronomonas halophila]|uniref:DUF7095 family protein n=1 Tax=Natronomonas halophila TaxID=2747817 RepID=UPI0015B5BA9B|nr:hypothetical protein [Natronomonas halophila]QLD86087.1 hypothetical protein HWV23_10225 [Natronomonas halophila]